jgi:flagellin
MALILNHNLPALRTARYVGSAYNSLSKSIERLSTGLRINTASDDAAGLAVRELMRADIAAGYQGIRNAADGVSLLQTADGAMGIIDQKLIKMKELAMQAANGTYSEAEVEIINSEYQSMAAEIDRIASSTVFNGVRLLDGSMNSMDGGKGMKIHFGTGNERDVDYYYINAPDVRATAATGLMIGGDGKNDIWSTGSYGSDSGGCCGTGLLSLSQSAVNGAASAFAYGYNWDKGTRDGSALLSAKFLAGRYGFKDGMTYEELIGAVNNGTQSRIRIDFTDSPAIDGTTDYHIICLGEDEAYYSGMAVDAAAAMSGKSIIQAVGDMTALGVANAINGRADSKFWAMVEDDSLYVFSKEGGNNNHLFAEEKFSNNATSVRTTFVDIRTGKTDGAKGQFSMGGEHWGRMEATQQAGGGYAITLLGEDIGDGKNIRIAGLLNTDFTGALGTGGAATLLGKLNGAQFSEIQDASDAPWDGAEIRTKESATKALDAVSQAILRKDQIRANLGALQTRLETVIETQTIHMENLQAAESRISDADIAMEMTEFTKNNVLTQAATAMLAQANSLSNLALTLILG